MFIDPFVLGVLTTLFAEMTLFIIAIIANIIKNTNNGGNH